MCWLAYILLINMPTKTKYKTDIKKVLYYLSTAIIATMGMTLKATGVKVHNIKRMINDKILTTSLNYNHRWITSTKIIRRKKDHWGFYRHRIKKYGRIVPIFHIERTAKATLSYLASRRPWGITEQEAREALGRDCRRILKKFVEKNAIQVRLCNGEKIYANRIHKKAEMQINHRRTSPKFSKKNEDEDVKVGVITYEEYCEAFLDSLNEMDNIPDISNDRLSALLLMINTNQTLRTMENWIKYNLRIQSAIGMPAPVDHTTINRAFNAVTEDFLKELFHKLVLKLHDKGVITGRFIVVDATHIYAYCNTRKNTDKHPVEGASWGEHHGSFYGYKVHILIDADSEMPIAMVFSTGKDHDSLHFEPLFEGFEEKYDFEEVIAVLADGAYDNKDFREVVNVKTGGVFLPACNPRKSRILKMLKEKVKKLFDRYSDRIHSVQDALGFLTQKFLTDFGIDIDSKRESKLVEMISERFHRHLRAGVERVFSRLKALSAFEHPKARRNRSVRKYIWWCLVGHLVQALTAHGKNLKGSMRKRTMLV